MARPFDVMRQQLFALRPALGQLGVFALAYVLAGSIGQGIALIPGVSVTFWPPAGIFTATLLLNARGSWPWWIVAAGAAELSCNALWFHNPVHWALIYFGANALEAMSAAWLIARATDKPLRLETPHEAVAFVLFGAIVAPIVGATLIAGTDALIGKHAFATTWPLVWLGDATGLLISTPTTLVAVQVWRERATYTSAQIGEAAMLAPALAAVAWLGLHGYVPTVYLSLPLLLWAAVRFQLRGAAVALALLTLMTALYTHGGIGEFSADAAQMHEKIVMLQAFLGVSAVSAILVAALAAQNQTLLQDLRSTNTRLEVQVVQRTESLRHERERLADALDALQRADRRKSEFLATLAHELRNPLAPIANAIHILRTHGSDAPKRGWALDLIDRQVQAMSRLIDDLLDLSRIDQDKIVLQREPVQLARIVDAALEVSQPHIEEMGQRLHVDLPAEPIWVDADTIRLTQVFMNLLNNAAKYTERGGNIELSAERRGEQVCVTIADSGVGIPADSLMTIFEMFSQVEDSLHRAKGGLGVGLHLVKRLVELHGGAVSAHSAGQGQGSAFSVRLPVIDAPVGHLTESAEPASAPARGRVVQALRVLVVDDNQDAAHSLAALLQLDGHAVRLAFDGQAALDEAAAFEPDVVICDIGLPKRNGYEVAQSLRRTTRAPMLVALTGWGHDDDRHRSRAAGFDHHLVKPVDLDALHAMLAVLAQRGTA